MQVNIPIEPTDKHSRVTSIEFRIEATANRAAAIDIPRVNNPPVTMRSLVAATKLRYFSFSLFFFLFSSSFFFLCSTQMTGCYLLLEFYNSVDDSLYGRIRVIIRNSQWESTLDDESTNLQKFAGTRFAFVTRRSKICAIGRWIENLWWIDRQTHVCEINGKKMNFAFFSSLVAFQLGYTLQVNYVTFPYTWIEFLLFLWYISICIFFFII